MNFPQRLIIVASFLANFGLINFGSLAAAAAAPEPYPSWKIPALDMAAESYFSPDSKALIFNGKFPGDETHHVYTANIDGTDIRKINGVGDDACSFFFPDNERIIWTSTKDLLGKGGNYSDPANYPQGAELYVSDRWGRNVKRLTNNSVYDAEVSVSPDGQWILFGRQINGNLDLWTMKSDGTEEHQVTFTDDWQEGGAFIMPDNETILYRAWKKEDQGKGGSLPMTIFTIKKDGSDFQKITTDEGTNWAPYPAPDGRHIVFVKLLPPHNYEIFLMDLITKEEQQLTFNDSFDGFPSISPDGHYLSFSSSREAQGHNLYLHIMDVSALKLGPHQIQKALPSPRLQKGSQIL